MPKAELYNPNTGEVWKDAVIFTRDWDDQKDKIRLIKIRSTSYRLRKLADIRALMDVGVGAPEVLHVWYKGRTIGYVLAFQWGPSVMVVHPRVYVPHSQRSTRRYETVLGYDNDPYPPIRHDEIPF